MTINPDHFRYHAPTFATNALATTFEKFSIELVELLFSGNRDGASATFSAVARIVDETVPDSADKTAAIRCLRIAHASAMEVATVVMLNGDQDGLPGLVDIMSAEIAKAQWQARFALDNGGK